MSLARLALSAAVLVLGACGARTGLDDVDASLPRDAVVPAIDAPSCARDLDCDDRIGCTVDRCISGRCSIAPDDAVCDDRLFCTGVERCDVALGCIATPPVCGDAVSCTEDFCDPSIDACTSEPRTELCPISHRCDPLGGCTARALAHDDRRIYEIDLPSGELHELGFTPVTLTDIALHPDGTLYGSVRGVLVRVDYEAGTVDTVVPVRGDFVGLDISPEGALYAASDDRVDLIDPVRGTATTVARFPGGLVASGDLAFVEGRLYATARGGRGGDWLVEVPLDGERPRIVGATGFDAIYGLAPFGATLYGLTDGGSLLMIDVTDGFARELTRVPGTRFFGAGAR